HYLANVRGEIYFALLSDWPDSQVEQAEADLEILGHARRKIAELNQRHPKEGVPRFHLLHRRRLYNESEHRWMGWERKRGKLHELNLLLRGDADTTFLTPEAPLPDDVVYVMTLDTDTRTTRDVVKRLAGKLAHPMNRPVFDTARRIVTSGYGILQPRVTASLTTGDEASFFQRVFSANRGMDPYVFAVSDVYQDIYGEGTFTGKGLYHIDAMEAALAGRISENSVLSHDLLEGALARAALVSDVEVVEDYPTRYSVDASRHHRWARGDWQLLPFIFSAASGVPAISRWKMIDNLRRTLTPIFWVASSIAAWTLLPFAFAAQWQLFLILILFVAPTFDVVAAILPEKANVTLRGHFNAFGHDVAFGTAQVALRMVLIAHSAWLMGDAIIRTLYRLFVSHEHMLEWRTALQAQRTEDDLGSYYRLMGGALVIALIGFAIPFAAHSSGAIVALIFCVFWFVSPAFAWLVSRSAETEDRLMVAPEDRQALRVAARRTWFFFETFVTEGDHWLPPDNFQETPHPVVAHRTSPTNISVYLLSTVAARDFGWIGMGEAITRLERTLDTIDKLDTFRGHIFNWYDTQTLQPLHPRYISAVDNGNFAGHLIAIAAACNEWATAPAAYMEGDFDGLLDVITILEETLDALPDDRRPLRPLRQRLRDRIAGIRRAVEAIKREPEMAAVRTINLAVMAAEIRKLAAAMHQETESAASTDLSLWADKLAEACDAHVDDAHTDEAKIEDFRARLKALATRCRTIAFGMDFSFLLREDRKLLSIGYRMADHQLDEACYDLLASEARLASLFAIAKGDVPTDHWFHLGRPIVEIGFRGALMSWSGSMFEYLMPPLVMKEPQGGILNQTHHLIIRRQMQYGHEKRIPWGISEAAFNARDRDMNYQYTNFGVPGLGLKRGLALNTVIAPYATLLASQYMPREAVQNLKRLNALGACGRYGYHDAVDFTPQRVPEGTDHAVVYNYFAHHSGMSIAAVANVVFEGRMRERFHSDPVIESAELLLQEKAPRNIPAATLKTEAAERAKGDAPVEMPDTRLILDPLKAIQATNLVSNGRYSVMVTAAGSGYSRYNDLSITRWQADPVEDRYGSYLFLRDVETSEWWSATAEPKQAAGETAYTLMSDDKTSFVKTVGTLRSEVECIVVSEGNGEGRRITISNDGTTERIVEVTSYAELVLAPEAADNAHPAFSKMFVHTEIARQNGTIFATRRKRDKNEADIALAHFVTDSSGPQREGEAETDRRNFIGRGRNLSDAAAFDPGTRLAGGQGFVLDPIIALRRRVRVAPNKKVVLTYWTVVGANREEVEAAIGRIDHTDGFARQAMLSWTRSQVQTHHVGLTLAEAANVQKLARYLIYPDKWMRRPAEAIATGLATQASLWPLGISGDFPIFAIRIGDQADLEIVANALRMQEYLRARGLVIDLVVVNEQASTYVQDLQHAIEALCENSRARGREHGPREHIFAVRRDLIDKKSYRTLVTVARVVVHTRNGTIFSQIERAEAIEMQAKGITPPSGEFALPQPVEQPKPVLPISPLAAAEPPSGEGLQFWNGFGGFDGETGDYVVRLTGTRTTPHPWINVISNQGFGFHTSAEGASFTWSRNSRDFQLTPWSNDPVSNRPGEAIYIHDLASGAAFSPFAAVARDPAATYEARHGRGFSTFHAIRGKLAMEVTQFVDPKDPVKISRLVIRNGGFEPARLRVYAYAEWVLGINRSKSAPTIVPTFDAEAGVLMARNAYSLDYSDGQAFMAIDRRPDSVTADRLEFIGRKGSSVLPEAVAAGASLSGAVEAGRDPCAAIACDIDIAPGEEATLLWMIGDAASPAQAVELAKRHAEVDFDQRLAEV
ncbi:MAG: glucoamylase family protein, partial [Rhizobiaceae bacterium]